MNADVLHIPIFVRMTRLGFWLTFDAERSA